MHGVSIWASWFRWPGHAAQHRAGDAEPTTASVATAPASVATTTAAPAIAGTTAAAIAPPPIAATPRTAAAVPTTVTDATAAAIDAAVALAGTAATSVAIVAAIATTPLASIPCECTARKSDGNTNTRSLLLRLLLLLQSLTNLDKH